MIYHGDLFDVLPTLEAESIDACVTDPPYGLEFMGKDWDKLGAVTEGQSKDTKAWVNGSGVLVEGASGPFGGGGQRVRYGRSAKSAQEWHERWAREVYRVLKPGAYLVAFGGTRTYHRMTCAIEDAGFEIRDNFAWVTGQGFPKNLNVGNGRGTALKPAHEKIVLARKPILNDSERGIIVANLERLEAQLWSLLPASIAVKHFGLSQAEHEEALSSADLSAEARLSMWAALSEVTDTSRLESALITSLNIVSSWRRIFSADCEPMSTFIIETASSTTIDWRTLRYCSSALTPQDIIQAEINAPGSRCNALLAARTLNAAAKSISAILELSALGPAISSVLAKCQAEAVADFKGLIEPIVLARKPLIGTVAENVLEHGTGAINIDACRIEGGPSIGGSVSGSTALGQGSGWNQHDNRPTPIDRSMSLGRWPANVLLDEQAASMLDEQSGELHSQDPHTRTTCSQAQAVTVIAPQRNSAHPSREYADRGGASRFFYVAKPSNSERNAGIYEGRSTHPTVKPVELMRWLVKLVTPPNGKVLDPFCGSGTTGMACAYEFREFIGVEREAEYVEIAKRRIAACAPLFTEVSL